MKQVLQNLRSGETTVADVPQPMPKAGMALVHTAASLVSAGTERMVVEFAEKNLVGKARSRPDLVGQIINKAKREGLLTTIESAFNRLDQPMPLGYSSAGTIAAVGEGLQGFNVGDRVACAGGGYAVHAEYTLVPQNLLTPLPDNVDFESAAFTTLAAVALHGFRLAQTQLGERVAVIGLGLLGLMMVEITQSAGCRVLGVDLDPQRVERARQLGAEAATRDQAEEAAQAFSRGRGVDAILICADTSSNDPVALAGEIARDRANVVATGAVGLDIPRKVYYHKELNLINSRSYGPGRYDPSYEEAGHDYPIDYVRWTEGRNMEAVVDLIARGELHPKELITHRFPIEEAPQAYKLITGKGEEPFLGVVLTYPQAEEAQTEPPRKYFVGSEPKDIKPEKAVRLGVLGAGNFANAVMLPALKKINTVELVGIVSGSGMSAHHAAEKFNFRYAASEPEELLNDDEINTIAILTRHDLHAEQVTAALEAGKHVFVEKPLAISREQLVTIEEKLQAEQNQLLTVGFNRRFAPLAKQLKAFLAPSQEPLVAHYRVNAGHIPLTHWLHDPDIGGGRIVGEGCHFIDFLTFLAGAPPVSVTAQALPDAGRYREDNIVLTFTFPDGSLGTLTYLANGDKAFPKERVEVFTGGRVAVLDDYRGLHMTHQGRSKTIRSRWRQDKGHRAEWKAFAQAILNGSDPTIPYKQLVGVTQASLAAIEALRSGQRVDI